MNITINGNSLSDAASEKLVGLVHREISSLKACVEVAKSSHCVMARDIELLDECLYAIIHNIGSGTASVIRDGHLHRQPDLVRKIAADCDTFRDRCVELQRENEELRVRLADAEGRIAEALASMGRIADLGRVNSDG